MLISPITERSFKFNSLSGACTFELIFSSPDDAVFLKFLMKSYNPFIGGLKESYEEFLFDLVDAIKNDDKVKKSWIKEDDEGRKYIVGGNNKYIVGGNEETKVIFDEPYGDSNFIFLSGYFGASHPMGILWYRGKLYRTYNSLDVDTMKKWCSKIVVGYW